MNGGLALWIVAVGLAMLLLTRSLRLGGIGLIALGALMLVPPPIL